MEPSSDMQQKTAIPSLLLSYLLAASLHFADGRNLPQR